MVELKRGGVSSMNSWEIFFLSNLLKRCLSFVCDCDLFGWVVAPPGDCSYDWISTKPTTVRNCTHCNISHSEEIKYTADNSLSIGEAG